MKRFFYAIASISVLGVSISLAFTLNDIAVLARQATLTLKAIQLDSHGTSQNLNAALIQIGLTTDELRRAASEQRLYWRKTSIETTYAVASLQSFIDDTNISLNGRVLPKVEDATNGAYVAIGKLADAADGARGAMEAIRDRVDDPALTASVANLARASDQLAGASEHVNATTKDVAEAVHKATRPASLAVRVVGAALRYSSDVYTGIVGYLK